jgi:aminopeptidase-like protein
MPSEIEIADTLLRDLFPICRSLTGSGNRETLQRLAREIPLRVEEVPSGTQCYDWTVPPEWKIRDAWIKDSQGRKIVDFFHSNVHLVNYSAPISAILPYNELVDHIHTLPEMPHAWPYRHSYYTRNWGFCMAYDELMGMDKDSEYEVYIDSEFDSKGSLSLADSKCRGISGREYLISTYCCHPSLANDNLSGLILSVLLFKRLLSEKRHHSYRLIIAPETIGVIAYLHLYEEEMKKMAGGYVVTTVGGPGEFGYKSSFVGHHEVDLAAKQALKGNDFQEYPFRPDGSDERQYSSPAFRIPTGTITKDKYYEYSEYHTSEDNLNFVAPENIIATLEVYWKAIMNLERNRVFERVDSHCEIQLGKYALYPTTGGAVQQPAAKSSIERRKKTESIKDEQIEAMSWLMYGSDGRTSLLNIAEKSGAEVEVLHDCASRMVSAGVLRETNRIE